MAATQAMLDRIVAYDNAIRSYLTLADESALEQAAAADRRRAAGEDGPLLGVPIAVKDILCTAGIPTTAGSKILEGFVPPYEDVYKRQIFMRVLLPAPFSPTRA